MAITEHQKINADEELRRRMEDREREAFDMAVIKGAAFKQGKLEGKAEVIRMLINSGLSAEDIAQKIGSSIAEINMLLSKKEPTNKNG